MDFIFDTESDIRSNKPALIQIFIVRSAPESSPVLFVETNHIPPISSSRFPEFQNLFHCLFRAGTKLYSCWPLLNELDHFKNYQLFHMPAPSQVINVQRIFTSWLNAYINKALNNNDHHTIKYDDTIID